MGFRTCLGQGEPLRRRPKLTQRASCIAEAQVRGYERAEDRGSEGAVFARQVAALSGSYG